MISETLNLTGMRNLCIEDYDFPYLRELCLSNCSLKQYPNLKSLRNLTDLDISYNGIYELGDGPKTTMNLKRLDLSGNFIVSPEHIRVLQENIMTLICLDLRFNPINFRKGYRSMIISTFTNLKVLDCQEITSVERVCYHNLKIGFFE